MNDNASKTLADKCRAAFDRIIGPLKAEARVHGYAIAIHGSLARDIDLVAIPWTNTPTRPDLFAEQCRQLIEGICGMAFLLPHEQDKFPLQRDHGRLVWLWHIGGGPYIDFSVMTPEAFRPK